MEHAERYKRAREFFDVVTGLWDSFADDAFPRDVEQGLYFDPAKMHVLDHKGEYLKVRGPAEHRPSRAGLAGDRAGRRLRRRPAACGRDRRSRVHRRQSACPTRRNSMPTSRAAWRRSGAIPSTARSCPAPWSFVGDSVEEAKEKRAKLDSLVHYDSGIASLSIALGTDASGFDPDGQLPPIPETNASKTSRQRLVDVAARDKLTVRQLAQRVGAFSAASPSSARRS